MAEPTFAIGGRAIGAGHPVYVVAELSANHGQELSVANDLVRAAARAGADAVKLQTYTPDTITFESRAEPFVIAADGPWRGKALYDLYREAHTPWAWHAELAQLAESLGMQCFSSPFDPTAVDHLESLHVPAYKIASFELVDVGLLARVAATGKPVIVSTGMATLAEIDEAVSTLRAGGSGPVALLKTNSGYPAAPSEMNLAAIPRLRERFDVVVGLSDHTLGHEACLAAVALGARIIEKHLTLSRDRPTPDAAFSLEPAELAQTVAAVRTVEQSLGHGRFEPSEREQRSLPFRRSLFVVADVRAGDAFTTDNVRSIRPANGLHPRHLPDVVGRRATRDVAAGTPLAWELVQRVEVTLRAITSADCGLVFGWANDPVVRAMSFHTAPIARAEHERWFAARLADPGCVYLALCDDGDAVGHVRFDDCDSDTAVVSITVAPERRGRGYATAGLRAGLRHLANTRGCRRVAATIRPNNAASLRAFANAGFEPAGGDDAARRLSFDLDRIRAVRHDYHANPEHTPYLGRERYDDPKQDFKAVARALAAHRPADRAITLADIGCANGEMLYYLHQQFPRWKLHGFDHTARFIEAGRASGLLDGVVLECADLADVGGRYDVVTSTCMVSLFPDALAPLDTMFELLEPGGLLVVSGLFNPYDIEVRVEFCDNTRADTRGRWRSDFNRHSQASIRRHFARRAASIEFAPVSYAGIAVPHRPDAPVRVWTAALASGEAWLVNGLHQIANQTLLIMTKGT